MCRLCEDNAVSHGRLFFFFFKGSGDPGDLPSSPTRRSPDLGDTASIVAGKELWQHAPLVASSLPNSPRIEARCADCHAQDGRDLKYFNFSNRSIVTRSMFQIGRAHV